MSSETPFTALLRRIIDEGVGRQLWSELADEVNSASGGERTFLFRFRSGGGVQVLAARDIDREHLRSPLEALSHHALRRMEAANDTLLVADARVDRRYRTEEALGSGPAPRSILVLPLRGRDRLAGGVYVDHRFRELDSDAPARLAPWCRIAELALHLRDQQVRERASRSFRAGSAIAERDARGGSIVDAASSAPADAAAAELDGDDPSRLERGNEPAELENFHGYFSAHPDVRDTFDQLRQLESSPLPILIVGETGVGKSALARAIHHSSSRRSGPFEILAGGAIPDSLFESEILGHVRGAFSGAEVDRDGIFFLADGGTLFLDDLAELSMEAQSKLLRVVSDGRVRPLGGVAEHTRTVDVRILAATSRDLQRGVAEGTFRGDLYYRLNSVVVEIPPLRDRPEDVDALARLFLDRYTRSVSTVLDPDARAALLAYSWPGNVRELENEMRRLAAVGGDRIRRRELAPWLRSGRMLSSRSSYGRSGTGGLGSGARSSGSQPFAGRGPRSFERKDSTRSEIRRLDEILAESELEAIEAALNRARGNKSRAAEELGITRKALYRRLRSHGLAAGPSGSSDAIDPEPDLDSDDDRAEVSSGDE
jgi:DNA-binding NtrC family response regulator